MIFPDYCNTELARQGYWGEMYVKNFYESHGFLVISNPDQYGGWDLLIVDKVTGKSETVQVKTVVRYILKNYFSIKFGTTLKGLVNLLNCDKLIIVVRNPDSMDDSKYKGKVLLVKNHKNFTLINNEYIIPSIDENFELLSTLTPDELQEVNSFRTQRNN